MIPRLRTISDEVQRKLRHQGRPESIMNVVIALYQQGYLDPQRLTTIRAEPDTCPTCEGKGYLAGIRRFMKQCPDCKGTGQV